MQTNTLAGALLLMDSPVKKDRKSVFTLIKILVRPGDNKNSIFNQTFRGIIPDA